MEANIKQDAYKVAGLQTPRGRGQYRNSRRREVMACTMRLFEENGYDAVTYEMIGNRAGVAKSAINKLFGDKHTLAVLCLRAFFDDFVEEVREDALVQGAKSEQEAIDLPQLTVVMRKHMETWRFILNLLTAPRNVHIVEEALESMDDELMRMLIGQQVGDGDLSEFTYTVMGIQLLHVLLSDENQFSRRYRKYFTALKLSAREEEKDAV